MKRHIMLVAVSIVLVIGCSIPGRTPPAATYTLATEPALRSLDSTGPVIEVAMPQARPGFATTGMAYREQPFELAYFAFSEWAAPPSKMLQPLLIQGLESSGVFSAVVEGSQRLRADRRLETEVVSLIHDFTAATSRVELALRAQLIDLENGSVIATRTFRTFEPAPSDDPYGGVVAANRALRRLLPQVVQLSTTGLTHNTSGSRNGLAP